MYDNTTVRLLLHTEVSCLEVDICDLNASCQYEEPIARCVCNPGYIGEGTTCSRIGAFTVYTFFFNFSFIAHVARRTSKCQRDFFLFLHYAHTYCLLCVSHYHVNREIDDRDQSLSSTI